MSEETPDTNPPVVIDRNGLDDLIRVLKADGRRVIGPAVRNGVICYEEIASAADLPEGWTDLQQAGRYRLERRTDKALFGYAVGPHSWKQFLHPPRVRLWQGRRTAEGFEVTPEANASPKLAFLGVRACELRAMSIQDRVFLGAFANRGYRARRQDLLIIAVNCGTPAATCFCASMGCGPRAETGFDLALTENSPGNFLVEVGTASGASLLQTVSRRSASAADRSAALEITAQAARAMTRSMPGKNLKETLQAQPAHPHWDDVAARCLSCGNCTMVCPTCFCTTVEDVTDLAGDHTERVQRWDSCFTADFSYIHGGPVWDSTRGRFRQWLTHKLAHWVDQFGTSGCVGCGRCIAWCPVGIDITAEARAFLAVPADNHDGIPGLIDQNPP